nr:uncharacterized protein LOC129153480 [Nothobranchius furzeri]
MAVPAEGVQPYPGSDNFYPTTPPSTSRTVLHSNQPSQTVRSHTNAKAVRYRIITPQTILEAEQRPTAYAPPISQPPPPPPPSPAQTDEQHLTAASISQPTPPPPPPPPPSPAQDQSDSDSETADRAPEQPAHEEEENAPPPAPVQSKLNIYINNLLKARSFYLFLFIFSSEKHIKKKKNIRLTPLQRLNRMKLTYLLLQINSGLVEVVQQVLAL